MPEAIQTYTHGDIYEQKICVSIFAFTTGYGLTL